MSLESDITSQIPGIGGRSGEARFIFNASQRVAPCAADELPQPSDFIVVRCYDLSRNGFSYLLSQPPTYDSIVAELTLPTQRVYLRARVAHITGMTVDGTFQFQVGCEFTSRVQFSDDTREPAATLSG